MVDTMNDTENNYNDKIKKKHKKRKMKDIEEENSEQSTVIENNSPLKKSKKKEKNKDKYQISDNESNSENLKKKKSKEKESKITIVNDGPDSEDEIPNIPVAAPISEHYPKPTTKIEPVKVSMLRPAYFLNGDNSVALKPKKIDSEIKSENLNVKPKKNNTEIKSENFNVSDLWHKGNARSSNENWNTRNDNNTNNNFRNSNDDNRDNQKFDRQEFSKKEHKWQKREEYTFTDELKCTSNTRQYTVSIAIPASILQQTCPLDKFKTYVVGQLSRSASIYCVDEIIVYNDNCWRNNEEEFQQYIDFMKMILEYQECPQYMKRQLFPMHSYLKDVGVLSVLNAPHHLLGSEWCTYREGIVLDKCNGKFSCVHVGLGHEVDIDRKLIPDVRVTVKFPPEVKTMRRRYGTVVSPDEPRTKGGLYWGYTVRTAKSLSEVVKSDRFKDGYDLIIGTSDKGNPIAKEEFKTFSHALIVFGGVEGLETAMESDSEITEKNPKKFFQKYLNTCPNQGSKTIRTEEAVLISLCRLAPKFKKHGNRKVAK